MPEFMTQSASLIENLYQAFFIAVLVRGSAHEQNPAS